MAKRKTPIERAEELKTEKGGEITTKGPFPTVVNRDGVNPEGPLAEGQVLTDAETGLARGIQMGGKTFFAPQESDISKVVEQQGIIAGAGSGAPRINAKTSAQQAISQQQQQQQLQQAQGQLIEEQMPTAVELNPEENIVPLANIPLIGSVFKGGGVVGNKILQEFSNGTVTDQELLNWAKNDIQRKEIEKGLTWSESLGAMFEGVPGVAFANRYVDIESPRGNLEEVHTDILSQYRRITGIESNVKSGYLPVEVAQEQINEIEQYIMKQEARLKLLIYNSPSLNFNSDRVNGFETDILKVREKIFQAKLNILSGAITDPTALDLSLKMDQQDEPDWATSPY